MAKKQFKSVSINLDTYVELTKLAKKDDRSAASMIRQLVYKEKERVNK